MTRAAGKAGNCWAARRSAMRRARSECVCEHSSHEDAARVSRVCCVGSCLTRCLWLAVQGGPVLVLTAHDCANACDGGAHQTQKPGGKRHAARDDVTSATDVSIHCWHLSAPGCSITAATLSTAVQLGQSCADLPSEASGRALSRAAGVCNGVGRAAPRHLDG